MEIISLILIVSSYLIVIFLTVYYLAKTKSNSYDSTFIWYGLIFILIIMAYSYFERSIYSNVMIAILFLASLSYVFYVLKKVKQAKEKTIHNS